MKYQTFFKLRLDSYIFNNISNFAKFIELNIRQDIKLNLPLNRPPGTMNPLSTYIKLCLSGYSATSGLIFLANSFQISFRCFAHSRYLASLIRFKIEGLSVQSGSVQFTSSFDEAKFSLTYLASWLLLGLFPVSFIKL